MAFDFERDASLRLLQLFAFYDEEDQLQKFKPRAGEVAERI